MKATDLIERAMRANALAAYLLGMASKGLPADSCARIVAELDKAHADLDAALKILGGAK